MKIIRVVSLLSLLCFGCAETRNFAKEIKSFYTTLEYKVVKTDPRDVITTYENDTSNHLFIPK